MYFIVKSSTHYKHVTDYEIDWIPDLQNVWKTLNIAFRLYLSQRQFLREVARTFKGACSVVMGATLAPAIFKPEKNLVFSG